MRMKIDLSDSELKAYIMGQSVIWYKYLQSLNEQINLTCETIYNMYLHLAGVDETEEYVVEKAKEMNEKLFNCFCDLLEKSKIDKYATEITLLSALLFAERVIKVVVEKYKIDIVKFAKKYFGGVFHGEEPND